MRLLILTQKVDMHDDVLGFFHGWLAELSKRFEKITVICLGKGEYDLPENVEVYSLGKEEKVSRVTYIFRFYTYIFKHKSDHDAVFVHMNAEYVALGGLFWKAWKKKVFLWHNHPKPNIFLRFFNFVPEAIFCTSPYAFSKRYKKTELMPAGIDMNLFVNNEKERIENSVLVLGRISPVKKLDILHDALATLAEINYGAKTTIVGDAPPQHKKYEQKLKESFSSLVENGKVVFEKSVPNYEAVYLYNTRMVYINSTPTGSFDKTILEAMACGALPLVVNKAYEGVLPKEHLFEEGNSDDLAEKLGILLGKDELYYRSLRKTMRAYVEEEQSLDALVDRIEKKVKQL